MWICDYCDFDMNPDAWNMCILCGGIGDNKKNQVGGDGMWVCKVCKYDLNLNHEEVCSDCGRDKEGNLGKKKKKWYERNSYSSYFNNKSMGKVNREIISGNVSYLGYSDWDGIVYKAKKCKHKEITLLGGKLTGGRDIPKSLDLLVLLDNVNSVDEVFDTGNMISSINYRLIFFPIDDRGVPRKEYSLMLSRLLEIINSYLSIGKKVHVQCIGGHGRTGLILALLVGRYGGIKEPIKWVRKNYCNSAVESNEQVKYISKMLEIPVEESYLVTYVEEVKKNEQFGR